MSFVITLITPAINLIKSNLRNIIIGGILLISTYLAIYITIYTLGKLKSEVFSYYPFDKFFPQSGKWSVFYFLAVVIFLGALVFFFIKGGFK